MTEHDTQKDNAQSAGQLLCALLANALAERHFT